MPGGGRWSPGDTWWPQSCLGREVGAGAMGTRGAPKVALSLEVGTGAVGTRSAARAALIFVFDLELVRGGTWSSGYRQYEFNA
jgi:hypothetical protein